MEHLHERYHVESDSQQLKRARNIRIVINIEQQFGGQLYECQTVKDFSCVSCTVDIRAY